MKKTKGMKRKLGIVALFLVLIATTVIGGLIPHFGTIVTTADVTQSVTISGHDWDVPITHSFSTSGGCSHCFDHEICNNGCEGVWLEWITTGVPDLEGIDVTYHWHQSLCGCDSPPMEDPFYLEAGECAWFCICYSFDFMIEPGTYEITSQLVEATI